MKTHPKPVKLRTPLTDVSERLGAMADFYDVAGITDAMRTNYPMTAVPDVPTVDFWLLADDYRTGDLR